MKIDRINKGDWGKIKAFFDVKTSDGFTIKGFKLVQGADGLFVGFPSIKDNEGEYRDTIFADQALKKELSELAISKYSEQQTDDPFAQYGPKF